MKKLLFSLCVLAMVPMAGFGQTYNFSGTVTANGGPGSNSIVCILTWVGGIDTLGCTMTDDLGFYSFDDISILVSDSVYVVSELCENYWHTVDIYELDGAVVDIDCGNGQPFDLYIGSYLIDEATSSWYFASNINNNVANYSWLIDGQSYSTSTVNHSFINPGQHQIDLTVEMGNGDSYSTSSWIYVNEAEENCDALFFQYNDSIADGVTFFANSSIGANLTYFWDFGDGNTSDEPYPSHTFADDMVYTVCLTITGDECESTYCLDVDPGEDGSGLVTHGEAEIEGISKSSGFQFVVVPIYSGSLSAEDADAHFEMNLYPNPSTGNVNLKLDLPVADNGNLIVTDLTGKSVYQQSVSAIAGTVIDVNLNQLPNGLYLIQYQGNLNSKVLKIAIQR
jgi:hypothetical protein